MERNDDMITYGRTCVYHLNYHIVWGIKHRNKVLNGSAEADLIKLLYDIADEKGFIIKRVEIRLDDHVHMIVSAPPKISVSTIVKCLKGTSAFRLFRMHPELKQFYWSNEQAVAKYINDQWKKENANAED